VNFRHLSIGMIFLLIGLTILSPFEEIFILIPLSVYLDVPELVPVFTFIAAICLGIGIYLVGKSSLYHFGIIGRAVAHHPVVILGTVVVVAGVVWYLVV